MTNLNEIYKCSICGNIVQITHIGAGILVCCGKEMDLVKENTEDADTEKHIPVIEKKGDGIKVKIGDVNHPMKNEHYIEWIEILEGEDVNRKYLKPGDKPYVEFEVKSDNYKVRAYCNIHGMWT